VEKCNVVDVHIFRVWRQHGEE